MIEVQGDGRTIREDPDGKIIVAYDNHSTAYEYDDMEDFRKDLEMFIDFGRRMGLLQIAEVVVI